MAEIKIANKITAKQFRQISIEFAKDLEAVYSYYEILINDLLTQAIDEGWDYNYLLDQIENLIGIE